MNCTLILHALKKLGVVYTYTEWNKKNVLRVQIVLFDICGVSK